MRLPFLIFIFFVAFAVRGNAEDLILRGTFQGQDLYVQNQVAPEGVGFCVTEVYVNDVLATDEVNSHAFIIDLSLYSLEIGNPVEVIIRCKSDCLPKVINPEAIQPVCDFKVHRMEVDQKGLLTWEAYDGATGNICFIEQHKWNRWVEMGQVMNDNVPGAASEFNFQMKLHSGKNSIRIKQRDIKGNHYSQTFEFEGPAQGPQLKSTKVKDQIIFSSPSYFEVYDPYGRLIKKGYGSEILMEDCEKGTYFVNFDQYAGVHIDKR